MLRPRPRRGAAGDGSADELRGAWHLADYVWDPVGLTASCRPLRIAAGPEPAAAAQPQHEEAGGDATKASAVARLSEAAGVLGRGGPAAEPGSPVVPVAGPKPGRALVCQVSTAPIHGGGGHGAGAPVPHRADASIAWVARRRVAGWHAQACGAVAPQLCSP